MRAWAYYNENDKRAAAWLRELERAGLIAPGYVDERSIVDVQPSDLRDYTQCHFFAGIGGWSYGLRLAGWPDDRRVWTGSCPCQPFSDAGQGKGFEDPRHLWPHYFRLIRVGRPPVCLGEQVASAAGLAWLDRVCADLEGEDYAVAAADLCAAGVGEKAYRPQAEYLRWLVRSGVDFVRGREADLLALADYLEQLIASAPHIRQRLFWLADAEGAGRAGSEHAGASGQEAGGGARLLGAGGHGTAGRLADSDANGRGEEGRGLDRSAQRDFEHGGGTCGLGHAGREGLPLPERAELPGAGRGEEGGAAQQSSRAPGGLGHADGGGCGQGSAWLQAWTGQARGFWSDYDLIPCRDGKARRIEPGSSPLAHGVPGRVGLLRGYGNAINPYVAAEFIKAYLETKAAQ